MALYETERYGIAPPLAFPRDLGLASETANYMMFETYNIRGMLGATSQDNSFLRDGNRAVILPIPGPPQTSYEQGWDQQEGGLLEAAANLGLSNATEESMSDRVKSELGAVTDVGKEGTGSSFTAIIGKLIGSQAISQASGKAIFAQTYATYSGPGFRSFSYNYSFKPLGSADVTAVDEIVKYFKIHSAPRAHAVSVARVYGLPKAFQIKYYNADGENQWINKIGKCALTNVSVNYGGDRYTTFEETHSPVQIDLSLTFKELQLQDQGSIRGGY